MATAHDDPDALGHEDPGHGAPGGGGAPVDEHGHGHDAHGHDDHGHDDHGAHGPADDAWVLPPIAVGIIIGIILIVILGLGTDAAPFS